MQHNQFYAYFDLDTGAVLAFANELRTEYTHKISVPYHQYQRFVNGTEKFSDWMVSRTAASDTEFELIEKHKQSFEFKNNLLRSVDVVQSTEADLMIHWDPANGRWIFVISDQCRQQLYDQHSSTGIRWGQVHYYITAADHINCVLQTVHVTVEQLILDKIIVPFASDLEHHIDKVQIHCSNTIWSHGIKQWSLTHEN